MKKNSLSFNWSNFRNQMWPSRLNGSLSPYDAIKLAVYLFMNYPLDKISDVRKYEKAISTIIGVQYAFALGGGRMGLYLLLKALKCEEGDEVIIPGYTCVVIPNAIRFAGCKPVYVDVRLSDYNMDPDALENAITPKTRVILLQHTYGIPGDIHKIREICRRRGVFFIEDAAHALGAVYDKKLVGQWGDATIYSTEMGKMISTDVGGILVTNDSDIAQRIKVLYDKLPIRSLAEEKASCLRIIYNVFTNEPVIYGRMREYLRIIIEWVGNHYKSSDGVSFQEIGIEEENAELEGFFYSPYPIRLSGILSKVGLWQINRLYGDVAERRKKAALLDAILRSAGASVPDYDREKCEPSYLNYPVLVDDREKWRKEFARLHIKVNGYLRDPLHPPETKCHEINGYQWGSCPNAEFISQHIINIPINRTMTFSMIDRLRNISF